MSLIIDMLKDVDKRLQGRELPPGLLKVERSRFSFDIMSHLSTMLLIVILAMLTTTILMLARKKSAPQNTVAIPALTAVNKSADVAPANVYANTVNITAVTFEIKNDMFEIRMSLSKDALYQLKHLPGNQLLLTIENAKLQADLPALVGYDMVVKSIQSARKNNDISFLITLNKDANLASVNSTTENNSNELVINISTHAVATIEPVSKPDEFSLQKLSAVKDHSIKSPTAQSVAVTQYQHAIKLAEAGNAQNAVDILIKLIQNYPDFHDARVSLAAIILDNGNSVEARKIVDEGLAILPDYPALLELKARILTSEGKINEALLLLQNEHPEFNENTEYYALMAALYNRTEKYEEAAKLYQKIVAINPHDSSLWFGLGVALDKLNKNKEALDAYRQASIDGKLNKPALAFLQNRLQVLQDETHAET